MTDLSRKSDLEIALELDQLMSDQLDSERDGLIAEAVYRLARANNGPMQSDTEREMDVRMTVALRRRNGVITV